MYIHREQQDAIFQLFESPFITAILGPRRVGKTTLTEQYVSMHPARKWVLMTMDKRVLRERVIKDELRAMIEEGALQKIGNGEKIWVVIDEAQKCAECFEQIKVIYDEFIHQDAIKFILTGSGYLELHELSAETLAGRVQLQRLREMNIRELVRLKHADVNLPDVSLFDLIINNPEKQELLDLINQLSPYRALLQEAID